ncbi:MAG: phosphoenolpyruvate--protein phosphotransferase [Treponema sp.]|jgi:phosphotransferase system enzyme I (PtsI)|nr:phosphoenolpyruvate--protein phosphotransferase [Treponema sp.]
MVLRGSGVSEGIAVGKIYVYQPVYITVEENFCESGQNKKHIERFEEVKTLAGNELRSICAFLEKEDTEKAKIFIAHQDILNDVAINEEIREGIEQENWTGDWGIQKIYTKFFKMIQKAKDAMIRERAADFEDVRKRILRIWHGLPESSLSVLPEPVIVAAHDLLPSDTATLDRSKVLAILTETGGTTSHSAIIARSYEIPAILGIPALLEHSRTGMIAAIDAKAGEVTTEPDASTIKDYEKKREKFLREQGEIKKYLKRRGQSADGVQIEIGLNIGSAGKEELEGEASTDFVGLFRTEFLYMGRNTLPSEEEQFAVYKTVLERYGGRPVTLRTLDIGGDKNLDCLQLPREDNPFLGNRALRLCFTRTDIFKTQLRAALRASAFGNLWLMLPMVGSIDDIRRAKAIIAETRAELDTEGTAYSRSFKTGIMIEIPAIALVADMAVKEIDFASIGTNDLCQYLTAVDRINPLVAAYYQSFHPAMFRLIASVTRHFNDSGKPLCVCGEMGGNELAAPVLAGMGMHKLSMGLASVARVKRVLSGLTMERMEALAGSVVKMPTAASVENYLRENLDL